MSTLRMRVSDAEYLHRYDGEVRRYVARHQPGLNAMAPGEAYLCSGRWAWVRGSVDAVARWCRYANLYRGGLKAINPDGTWREWDPRVVR